jgi:glycosyltransferase involved in cell wall biosynthesis
VVSVGQTGLLVKPQDAGAVAQALKHLLNHPQQAREMGQRDMSLIRECFRWTQCAEQYVKVYRKAIES